MLGRPSLTLSSRHANDDLAGAIACHMSDEDRAFPLFMGPIGGEFPLGKGDVRGEGKVFDQADSDAVPLGCADEFGVDGLGQGCEKKEPESWSKARHSIPQAEDAILP